MTIGVCVHGAAGRMGRGIIRVLLEDKAASIVSAVDTPDCSALGLDAAVLAGSTNQIHVALTDRISDALSDAQVVIDFTLPRATRSLVKECLNWKLPMVIGTTGLEGETLQAIDELAKVAPVVVAPNFSVGVNVLWHLAGLAVHLLGSEFDIEIVEMHHKNKVDAPSGTAVRLTQAVAAVRDLDPQKVGLYGRHGQVGARKAEEIGVHALRGGDVVGDHTLILAGPGERVELTHRAHTREIFARGAVKAAHWIVEQGPGRYDMGDVLGLPTKIG